MNTPGKQRPLRETHLVFGAPKLSEEEIDEVVATLRSGWIGTGPKVTRFEAAFADYKGVAPEQVAAVGSCTAALQLSMEAAGVGPGDEVITTAMTFCATVNAIIHTGATPVLVDIDPVTLNIDPEAIEAAITPRTRAVVVVHFAGLPCDMKRIMRVIDKHGLLLIEDCAHAIETRMDGKPAGTFGDYAAFSFYVTKNVTTAEGGMVIGRNPDAIHRIKTLALHGMSKDAWKRYSDSGYKHYLVEECGYKYNMTDIQAAIGIHQLARVEANLRCRQDIWARYMAKLEATPLVLPGGTGADAVHARHLFCVRVCREKCGLSRDEMIEALYRRKIGTGVHYLAIPEHPYYQEAYGWKPEDYPHATHYGRDCISLPFSPYLTDGDVGDVIAAIYDVMRSV